MPKGPQGQWRPAGDNECAALVCQIATGESPEVYDPPKREKATEDARRAGKARAEKLSPERRSEIATAAAEARWAKGAE